MIDSNTVLILGIGFGFCIGWTLKTEIHNLKGYFHTKTKITTRKPNKFENKKPAYFED